MTDRDLGFRPGIPLIVSSAEYQVKEFPLWVEELSKANYVPDRVIIADPLSYCAGVVRANRLVDLAIEENQDQKIYLYHAPIHNDTKLAEWEAKNAQVVNAIDDVPENSTLVISAHGVSPEIVEQAKQKHLRIIDATCPLVKKTHREVRELDSDGFKILLVGHSKHDEIVGTFGEAPNSIKVISPDISDEDLEKALGEFRDFKIGTRTQTTLAVSDTAGLIGRIQALRPEVNLPKAPDICFATENRQRAVIEAIEEFPEDEKSVVIIFGSDETKRQPSGNTLRLREVALGRNALAYIVEDISEINPEWLRGAKNIGISAGASAAPERVGEFLECMRSLGMTREQIYRVSVADESRINFTSAKIEDYRQLASV